MEKTVGTRHDNFFFCLFVFAFAGHMTHTEHHMMWSIGSRLWEGFIATDFPAKLEMCAYGITHGGRTGRIHFGLIHVGVFGSVKMRGFFL